MPTTVMCEEASIKYMYKLPLRASNSVNVSIIEALITSLLQKGYMLTQLFLILIG
jgi:hypothetical protein